MLPVLNLIVPVFNEAENLPELYRRLDGVAADILAECEFLFVDDGSTDGTARLLAAFAEQDARVRVLHFSRNFGHQAAVTAGLEHARGDAVVILDGDLQDPPELLPTLLERWREGYDVVYAVRTKRKEHLLKRAAYALFYRSLRATAEIVLPVDSGDFCLMDRRVVDAINAMPERGRFVRGLRAYAGFRQVGVQYERDARYAGAPKYTLRKLVALALQGVVNFSTFPVQLLAWLSVLCLTLAFALAVWSSIAGFTTAGVILCVVIALSGVHLAGLAILGWYLLQIFTEVKARPAYILGPPTVVPNHAERQPTTMHV